MSAALGITSLLALVACPAGCVYNEVSKDISKVTKTINNEFGVTVQAKQLPMVATKVSCKGRGYPSLTGIVSAAADIAAGVLVAVGVSISEDHEDYPSFTIDAEARA